ncbi:MAG: lipoyl synthase [Anaerolineaceae bacterium]|nr:lipoyl synthase [Anaerolineaceae bacterium]
MPLETTRDRISNETLTPPPLRRPDYIRIKPPATGAIDSVAHLVRGKGLHTVCEEAGCPNLGECWAQGTATFLILGKICTRACGFCNIQHGRPDPLDWDEPERVAQAVYAMGLKHAVITSVNRDDRQDGGAPLFAMTIQRIHDLLPGCSVEVLIPDFKGSIQALKIVMDAHPEILNHNVETVPGLFKVVQPQDRWEWSRATLENARRLVPNVLTKSGIMVGLGEQMDELHATMQELRSWGVDILTIGQYLQPSRRHLPIKRYYTPDEFEALKEYGLQLGFRWVESAPLVRSSYHAANQVAALLPRSTMERR